jgi:hypothetical protein
MATSGSFGGSNTYEDIGGGIGKGFGDILDPFNLFKSPSAQYLNLPGASKYTAEQQLVLQQLLGYLSPFISNPSSIPNYMGELTAQINPTQTSAIQNIAKLMDSGGGSSNSQVLSQIMKMVSGENFNPEYMRKDFAENVEKPLVKTFKENTVPELSSAYAKSGNFYGSGREKAVKDEAQTLMDSLSKGRSSLESSIYSAGLANQQQGVSDFSNFLQTQGGLSNLLMSMGTTEQATRQATDTANYNQWAQRNVPGAQPYDALLQAILGLYPNYDQTTLTQGADTKSGQAAGIAGIISSIFG